MFASVVQLRAQHVRFAAGSPDRRPMDRLVPGHWGGRMLNREIFRLPEHLEKSAMRPCSAHELHKICHVGPQIDMHMHKLSQFGPHRCTHGLEPTLYLRGSDYSET